MHRLVVFGTVSEMGVFSPHSLYCSCPCAGKLTDMHGNTYRYDANVKHMNSAGVLAALRNHEYYKSRVPQSVLQALKTD